MKIALLLGHLPMNDTFPVSYVPGVLGAGGPAQ